MSGQRRGGMFRCANLHSSLAGSNHEPSWALAATASSGAIIASEALWRLRADGWSPKRKWRL